MNMNALQIPFFIEFIVLITDVNNLCESFTAVVFVTSVENSHEFFTGVKDWLVGCVEA